MNPGLLILGASGSVARSVLRRLAAHRGRFRRLVLLDKNDHVRHDRYVDLRSLRATFVREELRLPDGLRGYRKLVRSHDIDMVLDLTDAPTLPTLQATDDLGVSYLNTCLSDEELDVEGLVNHLLPNRRRYAHAPHILCTGMNPGAVNMWVVHGIERFGVPRETIHFEYDTSTPVSGWKPVVTWSKKEYLSETVWNPSGLVREGHVIPLRPNALAHAVDMAPILRPILPKLGAYPHGFTVLHEENLTLARRFGHTSKFVYALHPRTMEHLVRTWRATGTVKPSDLVLGDNTEIPLTGSDLIGVCLEYPRRRVYYTNEMHNSAVIGTNATCAQVAVGVLCGLFTLMVDRLPKGVHFVGGLRGYTYRKLLFDNMRVEETVFERVPGHGWSRGRRTPAVRLRLRGGARPFYF